MKDLLHKMFKSARWQSIYFGGVTPPRIEIADRRLRPWATAACLVTNGADAPLASCTGGGCDSDSMWCRPRMSHARIIPARLRANQACHLAAWKANFLARPQNAAVAPPPPPPLSPGSTLPTSFTSAHKLCASHTLRPQPLCIKVRRNWLHTSTAPRARCLLLPCLASCTGGRLRR